MIKVGTKLKLFFNKDNVNNKLMHIQAIVDDDYIVYKYYNKSKGWKYVIEHRFWFESHKNFLTER